MSESKRFKLSEIYSNTIMDTENCVNNGSHCRIYDIKEVVDLLNEQSERIKSLEMELDLIANTKLFSRRKLEEENEQLKKENEKLGNIHLSIDLTYSCGYGRYIADVRVVDDE